MRLIKLALISFVFLFLLVTLISLLIPSHIRISKAIDMEGGKDSVFALVQNEGRWRQWHPAFMNNDSFRRKVALRVQPGSSNDSEIVVRVVQDNRRPVVNGWKVYRHPGSSAFTLQWYMDFDLPWYPWQKFGSLFYENTYGMVMQRGLNNIKSLTAPSSR